MHCYSPSGHSFPDYEPETGGVVAASFSWTFLTLHLVSKVFVEYWWDISRICWRELKSLYLPGALWWAPREASSVEGGREKLPVKVEEIILCQGRKPTDKLQQVCMASLAKQLGEWGRWVQQTSASLLLDSAANRQAPKIIRSCCCSSLPEKWRRGVFLVPFLGNISCFIICQLYC